MRLLNTYYILNTDTPKTQKAVPAENRDHPDGSQTWFQGKLDRDKEHLQKEGR